MSAPFCRAMAMASMLAGLAATMTASQYQAMLPTLAPYRSRGKGKGTSLQRTSGMTRGMRQCNNAFESVGHQGAREMARRVRQREKRDAKNAQPYTD